MHSTRTNKYYLLSKLKQSTISISTHAPLYTHTCKISKSKQLEMAYLLKLYSFGEKSNISNRNLFPLTLKLNSSRLFKLITRPFCFLNPWFTIYIVDCILLYFGHYIAHRKIRKITKIVFHFIA